MFDSVWSESLTAEQTARLLLFTSKLLHVIRSLQFDSVIAGGIYSGQLSCNTWHGRDLCLHFTLTERERLVWTRLSEESGLWLHVGASYSLVLAFNMSIVLDDRNHEPIEPGYLKKHSVNHLLQHCNHSALKTRLLYF